MPDDSTRRPARRTSTRSAAKPAKPAKAAKPAKTRAPARGAKANPAPRAGAKGARGAKASPAKRPVKKPAAKPVRRKVATAAPPAPPPAPVDPIEARRAQAREFAKWIAVAGIEKKADRIEIIDVGEKVDYADFLVLMSGRSDRQVQAIAGGIDDAMRGRGVRPQRVEGMSQGHWVLVDYADVIVHVFLEDARRYYDLDSLWMDARRVPFEGTTLPSLRPPPPAEGPTPETP